MPSWNEVLAEIQHSHGELSKYNQNNGPLDVVRKRYVEKLTKRTGRNTICYYSGWLQKPGIAKTSISDDDKNAFMAAIHNLDRGMGLDLILHTPGGDIAATESLVYYLRQMFGTNMRAIVPQIAMSAGTMIACACKEIVMGKQSNIGPIDPQVNGMPAHGVIAEFDRARSEVASDPRSAVIWQQIISKYHPTFLQSCEQAIELSKSLVEQWLASGMFLGEQNASDSAQKIVSGLNNFVETKTHSRHIHMDVARDLGLKVFALEDDPELQDLVLTVHHAYQHTLANSPVLKIVENNLGQAMMINMPEVRPS
jgi:hypothetical protein